MNIKPYLFCLLIIMLANNSIWSQEGKNSGKISYSLGSGSNNRILDMWFNDNSYIFNYREPPNAADFPSFKNKKYRNIQDSLDDEKKILTINNDMLKIPTKVWYGNLSTDTVINSASDSKSQEYCIKDLPGFITWQLHNDTTSIDGYKCQKATGKYKGMDYIGWFSLSIPVSVAPLQFRGLPGLILSVQNLTNSVKMEIIDLEWPAKEVVTIKPCNSRKVIMRSEMIKIQNAQNAEVKALIESIKNKEKSKKD